MSTPSPAALQQALGHPISDKRLEVLRRIGSCGSISQAARDAGISYKAAWQAIDTLSSLSGVALVERTVGGSGGGGAQLTDEGQRLLRLSDELAAARQTVLDRYMNKGPLLPGSGAGLGLRTSMRNLMHAQVQGVERGRSGDPLVRVVLQVADGQTLTSSVTQESADLLGLVSGLSVLVMCKATAVTVVADAQPMGESMCQLKGKVLRTARGEEKDEVTLALDGGAAWVGFAVHPFIRRKGQRAVACFPSSAVVIALPS